MLILGNNAEFLSEELKNKCVLIIEKEVDSYFSACTKAAYSFSFFISENLDKYSNDVFERMVLSGNELEQLKQEIINRLNLELEYHDSACIIGCCHGCESSYMESNGAFKSAVNSLKSTQHVTSVCQKAIDRSFSAFVKKNLSNPIVCKAAGKIRLGERLLGEYSLKNQIKRHQQQIYDQVIGLLTNIKVNFRSEMEDLLNNGLEAVNIKGYHIA